MTGLNVLAVTYQVVARPVPTPTVASIPQSAVLLTIPVKGDPGPQGISGPSAGFTAPQTSPAATWTIANPLGRFPRSVSIFVGGELVDADVAVPDLATVVVTFASPQTGRAEIS
jgi:hypothetical protein